MGNLDWTEVLKQHLTDTKDIPRDTEVLIGVDTGPDGGMLVFGRKAVEGFIIIDEIPPMLGEELAQFLEEVGFIKKPSRPNKQPDWARHNQAPRSARKHR